MDLAQILAELKAELPEGAILSLKRRVRPGRPPDVSKIFAELKAERKQIEAVLNLERLARGRGRRPKSRPSRSNDPGSQPPPAAPAAVRIAGRLDVWLFQERSKRRERRSAGDTGSRYIGP